MALQRGADAAFSNNEKEFIITVSSGADHNAWF
jgi:hypothetical protein